MVFLSYVIGLLWASFSSTYCGPKMADIACCCIFAHIPLNDTCMGPCGESNSFPVSGVQMSTKKYVFCSWYMCSAPHQHHFGVYRGRKNSRHVSMVIFCLQTCYVTPFVTSVSIRGLYRQNNEKFITCDSNSITYDKIKWGT